ncbi:YihY/virulence factor BrkB family protein [uncultured Jatrophihabitans sp.]|uniref:YihY/virulence factor BrkB family protein n=1 Tax=uncultured Jatrophihabitans sp. TaxID=1610747 RepID=UPI0035CBD6C0
MASDSNENHANGRVDDGRHQDAPGAPDRPKQMPKAGWVTILKRSLKQFKHDDVTDRAAALTYYGVLAIFPALLALISILGLLGTSTINSILANVKDVAPGAVNSFLNSVIGQVQGKAGAAGIAGIVGILLALWSASGYVSGFMNASNAIYDVDEGRPIWKTAPTRFLVTLALMIMLAVSAVLVVVSGPIASQFGKAFGIGHAAVLAWDIAKWPFLLIVVSMMFSLLYKASPNVKQPGFRWISLGGIIAVVVWLIASGLFALYVSFAGSYNKTYGSFATVIIFLVWLWITNIAILLGAEFNAETQRERALRAGLPEDVDQFNELRDTRKLDEPQKREAEEAAQIRERTMRKRPPRDR